MKQVMVINSLSLGDTICATPTLRKLYNIYNSKLDVISYHPEVFKNNPCVNKVYNKLHNDFIFDENTNINETFKNIGIKIDNIEKKHNVFDIRQFHATDLGFMLTPKEMTCEFYPDKNEENIELRSEFSNGYVVLHPVQTWPSRTWSKDNWIELINLLKQNNINYVLVGKDDKETGYFDIIKKVYEFNKDDEGFGINLLNNTTLSQTWNIINNAKCIITMDSGILHLAGTTNTHIIQLGSSINNEFRAPYRYGLQTYKYNYINGECNLLCASEMKYSIKEWDNIQSVPALVNCLENKPTFECHPSVSDVFDCIKNVFEEKYSIRKLKIESSLKDDNWTDKQIQYTTNSLIDAEDKRILKQVSNLKKILYIVPHLSTGGMPKYLERCIELLNDKFDIYLIEYSFYSPDYIVQRSKILSLIDSNKFWSFDMDWSDLTNNIKEDVLKIIDLINPDIIHLHEIPELFLHYNCADKIYDSNRSWSIIETTHTTTFNLDYKKYLPDKFIHVGNYIAKKYKNKFENIPYDIIEYEVPNKNKISRVTAIKKLGFNDKFKHILNVSIFTPNKGQDYIIKLANRLIHYNILFHFIGNQADNFREYWQPLNENLPINCLIHGEKFDVDDWYAACDLFIFPSKLENNPIVLKEAISWNMPILYKNLEVYDEKHDIKNYDYAIELTEDINTDAKFILQILGIK